MAGPFVFESFNFLISKGASGGYGERLTVLPGSILPTLARDGLAGIRIQDQAARRKLESMFSTMIVIKIEHVEQSPGVIVKGRIPNSLGLAPVILDKSHDRRLVGYGVIHEILFREGRNDDQRHPGTEGKAALIAAQRGVGSRCSGLTIIGIGAEEIVGGLGFVDHRRHDMVVPAI